MTTSRRQFLQIGAAAGGAVGLGLAGAVPATPREIPKAKRPLKILILGGTKFIGPALVEYAQARGHEITLFNRGKTNTHLFPDVKKLKGDRDNDLESLRGHRWDAVIDNSASIPRWVRDSAGLLKEQSDLYLYTSSISVYQDTSKTGINENDAVGTIEDPTVEEITGETYGPLKALCEQEAQKAFGDKAIVVRPGLIVGPMDPTDRFTYWPVRIQRGGEVMAPGNPTDAVQFIDVRDLSEWYVKLVEDGASGVFNATGPAAELSIAEMLYGIRAATSAELSFTWVDADFLQRNQVQAWMEMTVWVPPVEGYEGFSKVDCSRAIAAGLTFRPLAVTAADTLEWWNGLDEERRSKPRAGLAPEKEARVLAAWHARGEEASGAEAETTPAEAPADE
jgi:2'-hydroxyisoflavone reductase